ncbi:MAG: hypothetical protein ACRD1X_13515 [Vicinamibacteria bacterium]
MKKRTMKKPGPYETWSHLAYEVKIARYKASPEKLTDDEQARLREADRQLRAVGDLFFAMAGGMGAFRKSHSPAEPWISMADAAYQCAGWPRLFWRIDEYVRKGRWC